MIKYTNYPMPKLYKFISFFSSIICLFLSVHDCNSDYSITLVGNRKLNSDTNELQSHNKHSDPDPNDQNHQSHFYATSDCTIRRLYPLCHNNGIYENCGRECSVKMT